MISRGQAKQRLIAHGFAIANDVEACANRMRAICEQLRAHEIDEFEMVEMIQHEVFGLPAELGLKDLTIKLLNLHVAERRERAA